MRKEITQQIFWGKHLHHLPGLYSRSRQTALAGSAVLSPTLCSSLLSFKSQRASDLRSVSRK